LVEERFLEKRPDKRYRLGRRIFELGLVANNIFTERTLAHEPLRRLAQSVRATVVLSARSGNETVYIDRVEGPDTVSGLLTALGTRLPIGIGAGGVAMLAAMDDTLAEAVIAENSPRYRRFGVTTVSLLRRRVTEAKEQGYALTESFYRPGFGGIGVIIPGSETRPELAISIVTSIGRLDRIEQFVRELASAASEVSAAFAAS
jgi:DNA-binding IclR family transcriptional regulator